MSYNGLCIACNHKEDEHPIIVLTNVEGLDAISAVDLITSDTPVIFGGDLIFEDFLFCKTFLS
jgi:hypothetical protein